MRILVTGGAGFIGSHIVRALADVGEVPVVYDALLPDVHPEYPTGWPAELDDVERIRGDVRDRPAMDRALRGVDAVCHQAAKVGLGVDTQDLPAYTDSNVTGTAQVLAAMDRADVGTFVVASSMVVYGEGRFVCSEHGDVRPGPRRTADLDAGRFEPPCPVCDRALTWDLVGEDAPLDPRNTYATTKLAQEHLASGWTRTTGGRAIGLRYHNVYGPRMPRDTPYAGVASIFRSALEAGRAPTVFEDGGQQRDFVHVRDVAAANLAALRGIETVEAGGYRAYNVASGTPHTIGDMAAELSRAMSGPGPLVTGDYRLGDVRHVVADPNRARTELGFTAQIPFAEGMQEFAHAPLR